ncbi:hypothetical protein NSQ62_07985 [Solibacillus sp. FSL H8-0523]|uniref:hypothetical protein n=1 Tax=Solibacillus sp. FSL H8-0523 TaxID=2954511 RepID=UPI00310161DA
MKFEKIGGSGSCSQYSLYDYTESPFGVTVMSIEIHRESENWWFVGQPKSSMNKAHMIALYEFLNTVLS